MTSERMDQHGQRNATKRPREAPFRWARFSVRGLLIATALVALPLAGFVNRTQRQREIVSIVRRRGGKVLFRGYPAWWPSLLQNGTLQGWVENHIGEDCARGVETVILYNNDKARSRERAPDGARAADDTLRLVAEFGSTVHSVDAACTPLTDAGALHLSRLTCLQHLNLYETDVSDAGCESLYGLTQLKELFLCATRVTGVTLGNLSATRHLQTLDLSRTRIANHGLSHLSELKELEYLQLVDTAINDEALREIGKCTSLVYLLIRNTRVTDKGLRHLCGLDNLRVLSLHGTQVTDAGLQRLERLRLEELHLDYTRVRGAAFASIKLPTIRSLGLGGCLVFDADVPVLLRLPELRSLRLTNTRVTDACMRYLAGARDGFQIGLRGTAVSDVGLSRLHYRRAALCLSLVGSAVTRAGIEELRQKSPRCWLVEPEWVEMANEGTPRDGRAQ